MRFTLPKLFFAVTMAALACAGLTMRSRGWAETIVTLSVVMFASVGLMAIASAGQLRVFRAAFALIGGIYLLIVMCSLFSPLRDSLLTTRALVMTAKGLQVPTTPALVPTMPIIVPATTTPRPATPTLTRNVPVTEQRMAADGTVTTTTRIISESVVPAPTPTTALAAPASPSAGSSTSSSAIYSYITSTPMIYDPLDTILSPDTQSFNYAIPAVSFLVIGHCVWAWLLALAGGCLAAHLYDRRSNVNGP